MSLTKGSGPFGDQPAGEFDFDPHRPEHVLYVEDVPRQVRVLLERDSFTVFEEDEEVFVHPRDPCTRIDVLRSSRSMRVTVDDVVVAESTRPRMLLETGLPVRWYLPPEDVRTDLLQPSCTTTRCPYKGIAHYWSLRHGQLSQGLGRPSAPTEPLVRSATADPDDAMSQRCRSDGPAPVTSSGR
jgi:uncharacterized protein (DUF427 family)